MREEQSTNLSTKEISCMRYFKEKGTYVFLVKTYKSVRIAIYSIKIHLSWDIDINVPKELSKIVSNLSHLLLGTQSFSLMRLKFSNLFIEMNKHIIYI